MKGAVCFVVLLCMTGYAKAVGVKESCDATTTCTAPLICQETKCKVIIGEACTAGTSDECVTSAATCPATAPLTCGCEAAHKPKADNSGCEPRLKIGAECATPDGTDECIMHSTCKTVDGANACQCDTNMSPSTDNATCLMNVGQGCTVNVTHCIMGAECTGAAGSMTCTCMAKSTANADNNMCQKHIGGACTGDAHCKVGTCKDEKCACADKETATDDMMECRKAVAETCTAVGECSDNTECKDDSGTMKCTCKDTHIAENGYCAMKQSGTCDANTRCVMHSTCKATKCTCEHTVDGDKCKSGAQAVIGSIFVLLAAFVTSRLV